jgi:hypothetical protein
LRGEVTDPFLAEEILGLLGRTHKDLAFASSSLADRGHHLAHARAAYGEAAHRTGGYYPCINAATMTLLLGDLSDACSWASEAKSRAIASLRTDGAETHWALATLGEAALILGDVSEAERRYGEAVARAGRAYRDVASMRRQARLIVAHRRHDDSLSLEQLFPIPRVSVFVGQGLLGTSCHGSQPLRAEFFEQIARIVRDRLRDRRVGFGYASAECGPDIVFLEAVDETGGETHVVLPYPRDQFAATRVSFGDEIWMRRFDAALARAAEVVIASDSQHSGDRALREYGDMLLLGLARMQSCALETELLPMALWFDDESSGAVRATAATWERCGFPVELLPLPAWSGEANA